RERQGEDDRRPGDGAPGVRLRAEGRHDPVHQRALEDRRAGLGPQAGARVRADQGRQGVLQNHGGPDPRGGPPEGGRRGVEPRPREDPVRSLRRRHPRRDQQRRQRRSVDGRGGRRSGGPQAFRASSYPDRPQRPREDPREGAHGDRDARGEAPLPAGDPRAEGNRFLTAPRGGVMKLTAAFAAATLGAISLAGAAVAVNLDFLFKPDPRNDTQVYLHVANTAFQPPVEQVRAVYPLMKTPATDFPVCLFLANEAHVSLGVVWDLRAKGLPWVQVMTRLNVPPERVFVAMPRDPGPPYGKAYGYWKKHPKERVTLTDDDLYYWVNVRSQSKYF